MNSIGTAIKRRRMALGLTQQDMSDRIHVAEKTYRNMENGVTKLDIDRLQQLAEALETNVIELINAAEAKNQYQENKDNTQHNQQINDPHIENAKVGNAGEVNISSDAVNGLFERMLADKDRQIADMREEIADLKTQLKELIRRLMK